MSASVTTRAEPYRGGSHPGAAPVGSDEPQEWFQGLAFEGPLDPGGALFASLLALGATIGLVVLLAAVVRVTGLG